MYEGDKALTINEVVMGEEKIRELYASGELTWGDLLVITGLHASELFDLLYDLINPPAKNSPKGF